MPRAVPPYFDYLIEAYRAARTGRHVHLGYWDTPPAPAAPCTAAEFEQAQARLADVFLDMAGTADGQAVLDVGCGFGGTLAAINRRHDAARLAGVNIDGRQLAICRSIAPARTNTLSFVLADACALPFAAGSFDRVLSLEAMFHFASRGAFLRQAFMVLRPGGRLVLSDILLTRPGAGAPAPVATIERNLRDGYGPWPDLWHSADALLGEAREAGFRVDQVADVTAQTLPTYRVTAPDDGTPAHADLSAGALMRWLHRNGCLTYVLVALTRPD